MEKLSADVILCNPEVDAKYQRLGFTPYQLGMRLKIGHTELVAVEHPFKGVAMFFTYITPNSIAQFEIGMPLKCSTEQIAGMIYVNISMNCREDETDWKAHFQTLGIPLFQ